MGLRRRWAACRPQPWLAAGRRDPAPCPAVSTGQPEHWSWRATSALRLRRSMHRGTASPARGLVNPARGRSRSWATSRRVMPFWQCSACTTFCSTRGDSWGIAPGSERRKPREFASMHRSRCHRLQRRPNSFSRYDNAMAATFQRGLVTLCRRPVLDCEMPATPHVEEP